MVTAVRAGLIGLVMLVAGACVDGRVDWSALSIAGGAAKSAARPTGGEPAGKGGVAAPGADGESEPGKRGRFRFDEFVLGRSDAGRVPAALPAAALPALPAELFREREPRPRAAPRLPVQVEQRVIQLPASEPRSAEVAGLGPALCALPLPFVGYEPCR